MRIPIVLTLVLTLALITTLLVGCVPGNDSLNENSFRGLGGMMGQNGGRGMMGGTSQINPGDSYETATTENLPLAKSSSVVTLSDGDSYTMTAMKVRKEIAGRSIVMYGYNGMIPGPLFAVEKGTRANITFVNNLDKDTTVHWHGLRGDYRFDGTPGLGQDVVKPGASFTYTLDFPDDGVYWYHPHVREDAQQELGLYGNIFVTGLATVAGAADQETYLVLDDIALTPTGIEPFSATGATHAIMGRFGNVLLVNG